MNAFAVLERFGFSPYSSVSARPRANEQGETNVPGMFVVGDLADSPVLKLVLAQGHRVGRFVASQLGEATHVEDRLDVVIIGAGPAGIAAAEAVRDAGLSYAVFEKERPFNTIHAFPKGKPIFAEPEHMDNPSSLWLEDAPKEELVERWAQFLDEANLNLHTPEQVTRVERDGDGFIVHTRVGTDGRDPRFQAAGVESDGAAKAKNRYLARRIIVAVGKRGAVRKLGVAGEDLDKVRHALVDPADHVDRDVLVVGGGDSAIEAAVATANAGARVVLSYRRDALSRPKKRNKEQFDSLVESERIRFVPSSTVQRVTEDAVVLKTGTGEETLPNDDVLVFIGAGLPKDFLARLGIKMEGDWRWGKFAWVLGFSALVYAFYVLKRKQGVNVYDEVTQTTSKVLFWPFGEGQILDFVPGLLEVELGFRTVDAGFWGTAIYSLLILVFGARAFIKYQDSAEQRKRYLSLIGFQLVFLFGIPEILVPVIHWVSAGLDAGSAGFITTLTKQHWMAYSLSVPWPLNIYSLVDSPAWAGGWESQHVWTAVVWLGLGAVTSFVLIPLYVWRNNEKFCSYLCGCGGLAESLGDFWRHLAPRGAASRSAEWIGVVVLFMAVPVTLLLLADAWQFLTFEWMVSAKSFAAFWYDLMVDFMLASLAGVAMYPILGNRVWCRFFCPLRAYMEGVAKVIGRLAIHSNDTCISCGQCTRHCQMGIEVQRFAEQQISFHNANSACIQCGICVYVCPMDTLTLGPANSKGEHEVMVNVGA
ncbi:MAG: NAD(P)-binding domain-containing protein [Myxococcota bacterium]